jgi:hypothetical protein
MSTKQFRRQPNSSSSLQQSYTLCADEAATRKTHILDVIMGWDAISQAEDGFAILDDAAMVGRIYWELRGEQKWRWFLAQHSDLPLST